MDGRVRLRGFDLTRSNYNAVCCTHCNYDMGYDHIHCRHEIGISADEVTCPECFTKQIRINPNRAPDSWYETNAPERGTMAERAEDLGTETYQVMENISALRVYDFEFPIGFTWDDVSQHTIDWGARQIIITWTDSSESRFDMEWGELEDEETQDVNIQDHHGAQIY